MTEKISRGEDAVAQFHRPIPPKTLAEAHKIRQIGIEEGGDGVVMGVPGYPDAANLMLVRRNVEARAGLAGSKEGGSDGDVLLVGKGKEAAVVGDATGSEADSEKERLKTYERELAKIEGFNEEQRKEFSKLLRDIINDLDGDFINDSGGFAVAPEYGQYKIMRGYNTHIAAWRILNNFFLDQEIKTDSDSIIAGLAIYLDNKKYKDITVDGVDGQDMHFETPLVFIEVNSRYFVGCLRDVKDYLKLKAENKPAVFDGLEDWQIKFIEKYAATVEYVKGLKKFIVIDNEGWPF